MVFRGDGGIMATSSSDGTVRIWSLPEGRPLATLKGHTGPVYSVRFSSDGRWLVTASADRTARLWNAEDGGELATYRGHQGEVNLAVVHPAGTVIATASDDGTVRLWPTDPLPMARSRQPRELTDAERERFELPAATAESQ
jgi:WD40 repeat protein